MIKDYNNYLHKYMNKNKKIAQTLPEVIIPNRGTLQKVTFPGGGIGGDETIFVRYEVAESAA